MANNPTYKVLWVDDQLLDSDKKKTSYYIGTQMRARKYNIQLDPFDNWEEAEISLRKDFDDYSAIILDAKCKIKASDKDQDHFITAVLPKLTKLFGEKRKYLPWYILSEGTAANFNATVEGASQVHSEHKEEWGEMLYIKSEPDDGAKSSLTLFSNIERIAQASSVNIVLFRHPRVFDYMGDGKLIDKRARTIMLKMLSALYFPEENIGFQYEGNPLRKVIEYMFRSAKNMGLLADGCIDKQGRIVLLDASRFMAGQDVKIYNGKEVVGYARWGNPPTSDKANDGDAIFPNEIANMIKNSLNFAGVDSHTVEGDGNSAWQINNQSVEQFFAYVMMVCHVICSFGQYVDEHSDVEVNKSNIRYKPHSSGDGESNVSDYEGKMFTVEKDERNNYHCGQCILSFTFAQKCLGNKVTLSDVQQNTNEKTNKKYPYYAKFTPIN